MKLTHKMSLSAVSVLTALSLSVPAFAVPNAHANAAAAAGQGDTTTTTDTSNDGTTGGNTNGASKAAAGKLKSCQNRQKAIDNILGRIVTRGQNQLDLFTTIATRVEDFKTSKNVTVANYDTLTAQLTTDKAKAEADLAAMKTTHTIDCTSSNPKATVAAFQSSLKTEIADLKTYKTDVKNLIVAVKTAAGKSTTSSDTTDTTKTSNTTTNTTTTTGGQQ